MTAASSASHTQSAQRSRFVQQLLQNRRGTASSSRHTYVMSVTSSNREKLEAEMKLDPKPYYNGGPMWWDYLDVGPEADDWLHDPNGKDASARPWRNRACCSSRNLIDVSMIFIVALCMVSVFAAFPLLSYYYLNPHGLKGGFGLGGTNASGQVPELKGLHRAGLIDPDTPKSAYFKRGFDNTKATYQLVFSDEFNVDGRSFYPGDDPFWEAVDLNYWGTKNYEWYDPSAVTTSGGAMHITLSEHRLHNLNFRSGMVTTWNKFCFTGGYVSAAVRLPGKRREGGTWPAFVSLASNDTLKLCAKDSQICHGADGHFGFMGMRTVDDGKLRPSWLWSLSGGQLALLL